MKKASFLVTFVALLQLTSGPRSSHAQERLPVDQRRTVEEALDLAGDEIGDEFEELAHQLESITERLSQKLEVWSEDNAQELEAWSEKYADQWEDWGESFERTLERLADDPDNAWEKWASNYERKLNRWLEEIESDLESDELAPKQIGDLVERNLKMLSKMPLGEMVDQVVEGGLNELSEAPWESLDDLGHLATTALEEPLAELSELLAKGSDERRALARSAREMGHSLERLHDDISRAISDENPQERPEAPLKASTDARIRALQELRNRKEITDAQRDRIDEMIETIRGTGRLRSSSQPDRLRKNGIDLSTRDQILEKIEREKKRHAETLIRFNEDLRKSDRETQKPDLKKSESRIRAIQGRSPKRVDGKKLDRNSKSLPRPQLVPAKNQRDGRDGKANRNSSTSNKKLDRQSSDDDSAIELLRKEIESLRKEVGELKKRTDK